MQNDGTIKGASQIAEEAFKIEYPAIYKHLYKYKIALNNRNKSETGVNYEWYALQRWGANYREDFFRPKIIWKRIGSIIRFAYDENKLVPLDSTCFATGKHIKYLVAMLNSTMGNYMLSKSPKTGTGDLLLSVQALEPILIPKVNETVEKQIEIAIDNILNAKNKSTIVEETQIDNIIYSLCKLNQEEITFLENCNLF